MKNTAKTLIIGIVVCMFFSGTLTLAGYNARKITYTIAGVTGIRSTVMNGLPGNPITDSRGNYIAAVEYGWTGTVTPLKDGYTFDPPNRTYDKIIGNHSDQSFRPKLITLTISGSTGISGVVINGLPGTPVTNEDGHYTATVDYNFTGMVTPTKEGYIFEPTIRNYDGVTSKQVEQDYTAKLLSYIVSGRITDNGSGLSGVVVKRLPGNPVTNENGYYTAVVDHGWNDIIIPTKSGYTFAPTNRIYDSIAADQMDQSYTAKLSTFTISGTVEDDKMPVKDVHVSTDGGNRFDVTDAKGRYTILVDYGWSGTVGARKEGYIFKSAEHSYDPVIKDKMDQHFAAKLKTFTVSGTINQSGVVMKGLPGNPVTNKNGDYTAVVDYGWNDVVTPTKEGYAFGPANRIYDPVTMDLTNQSYTAELLTFDISGTVKDKKRPIEGVYVSADKGGNSAITDAKGQYSITVDYGWSGKVKPQKEGYVFKSTEHSYDHVVKNQTDRNFAAKLKVFTISGTAGQGGVMIKGLPGDPVTNKNGYYFVTVDYGFSGTATPTREGYVFEPANKSYAKVTSDKGNQSYYAMLLNFTISGTVMIDGKPVEGVLISANNGGSSDTTNAQGRYSVTVNYGWSGMVKPTKEGYIFDPPGNRYENVTSDINEDETEEDIERKATEKRRAAQEQRDDEQRLAEWRTAERKAAEWKATEKRKTAEKKTAKRKTTKRKNAKRKITEEQRNEELRIAEQRVDEWRAAERKRKAAEQRAAEQKAAEKQSDAKRKAAEQSLAEQYRAAVQRQRQAAVKKKPAEHKVP